MKRITIVQLPLLIMILFFGAADIRAAEYYFVTLEYPPLEFKDNTGRPKGAAVEIVNRIMAELGHRVSIEVLPWARAVKMVKYGRADAIFTIFKNDERALFLDFSDEVLIPQMVAFYGRKDSRIVYSGDLEALKHLRIGVVSTISYGRKFDFTRTVLKIERTATLEQNFSKMILGRIDLVINNVYSAEIVIKKMGIDDKVKRLQPSVESVPSYIAFSKIKRLATLQKEFDRKLLELKESGKYDEIIQTSGLKIETDELE